MASPSHRRARRKRGAGVVMVCVGLAAVALAASLVMALRPEGEADAGRAAATAAAGARAVVPPTATGRQKPSTPSPTSTVADKTPSAAATTAAAQQSARSSAPRTASTAAPLAGRIRPAVTYRGVATLYDAGDGDGACSYGPSDDLMIAAMNHTDYEVAKACGAYVRVRAAGGASVTVRITNECPLPCAPGQLDLSAEAFAKLADPSLGRIPITWSLVSPGESGTVSIRYKSGSSQWWCGIQVLGHRNPVARLEVRGGRGWTPLARTEYNYFLSEQGSGCGGAVRITDIHGERLTVDGLALRPDVVQPTSVQFAAR